MSAWFNKFLAVVTVSAGVNVAAQAQSNEPILPTLPGWEDTEVISGGSHQAAQRNQQAKQQAQGQKTVVLVPCRDVPYRRICLPIRMPGCLFTSLSAACCCF